MLSSFSLSCLTSSRQSAGESEEANSEARAAHFAFENKMDSSREATVDSMLPPARSEDGLNPEFNLSEVKILSRLPLPASYSKEQSRNHICIVFSRVCGAEICGEMFLFHWNKII